MSVITLEDIDRAADRIRGVAIRTPLVDVSHQAGRRLWLKCENLQVAGAFKIRGAYNKMAGLVPDELQHGVITYSSGNHAQAVAYAARAIGVSAVVVMPHTASTVKVEGARAYGAEVLFEGTTSAERQTRAEAEAARRGLTMIPPFDDPTIIAGQGTVGREILEDVPHIDRLYVPIGGGGLISGVAAAVKRTQPLTGTRVIGVEPVGAACMTASLEAGHPVTLASTHSVADGLLPVRPGDLTYEHVETFVDDVVTVQDETVERAVAWLCRFAKLVVEPSGAVTVAAAFEDEAPSDGTTVAVLSGGNIALSALSELLVAHTPTPQGR